MSASPQVEDGHIKIANELYDAVLNYPFTARQLKVLLAIVRKTYGFNKKRDDVSASQISALCGVQRNHVTSALNELAALNVIFKVAGEYGSIVELNKDYTSWTSPESGHPLSQNGTSPEMGHPSGKLLILQQGCPESGHVSQIGTCPKTGQVDSPKSGHTKDNLPKDIKHSRAKKSAEVVDEEFEEAWRLYPKRDGGNSKTAARKAWDARRREWLRDRMWLFALVGSASIDRLLTVFNYGYKRYGIRHVVIDSLMMTDVQADGPGSMTSQKDVMRKLAGFARQNGVHVHLVAHPRKSVDERRTPGKQDVSGSGIITDAADNVFAVWSAQKQDVDPADDEPDAFLELHKNRNGETQHRRLALFFNRDCMQFSTSSQRRPYVHVPFSQSTLQEFA